MDFQEDSGGGQPETINVSKDAFLEFKNHKSEIQKEEKDTSMTHSEALERMIERSRKDSQMSLIEES